MQGDEQPFDCFKAVMETARTIWSTWWPPHKNFEGVADRFGLSFVRLAAPLGSNNYSTPALDCLRVSSLAC